MHSRFTGRLAACLLSTLVACVDSEPGNLVPATVDEDPSLPSIELADTLIHSEAFGDPAAPLVIAIHGGPGSDYRSMLPLAALGDEGYRIVFWDQRGTGLSKRHEAESYSTAQYREDLRLLVEHYTVTEGQPLVFIGHSWGAMYATQFINDHGDYGGRVKGAILSEPGAFTKAQLDDYLDKINGEISLTSEQLNDGLWSRQFISATDQERGDYLIGLLAYGGLPSEMEDPNNPTPFWRMGSVVNKRLLELVDQEGFDFTTNLSAFPSHVLFLRGELNTVVTLEHQQNLATAYPSSEVITIPGVGHEVIYETPEQYLEHTRAYFQQIGFTGVTP